jgi:uncharacterized membrane protein
MSINISAKASQRVALFLLGLQKALQSPVVASGLSRKPQKPEATNGLSRSFRLKPEATLSQGVFMRPNTAIGIVLVVLGVLALAYQGITYTRQERVLDIGPVHATAEKHERISIPPLIGGLVLAGGIGLLFFDSRRKT